MSLIEAISRFDPRVLWIAGAAVSFLAAGWLISMALWKFEMTSAKLHRELMLRIRTWALIIPVTILPILAGAPGIAGAVFLLGLVCHREFSRAIGLQRDRAMTASVVIGLLAVSIAIVTHDYQLLLLSAPIVAILTVLLSLFQDQPTEYLKRVSLTNLGFILCGLWPGHLGFLGTGQDSSITLLWIIMCICLNDVFAFAAGRTFGKTPLCPNTSPGKTREGFVGAIVLTTLFATLSGHLLFPGESLGQTPYLILIGVITSVSGSAGDLIISSIKRDLNLKDLSDSLPGHGGILDRCDSLIFSAPVIALTLGLI